MSLMLVVRSLEELQSVWKGHTNSRVEAIYPPGSAPECPHKRMLNQEKDWVIQITDEGEPVPSLAR